MKRYRGWIIAGAVLVALALLWVIGRSSETNEAQSPTEPTRSEPGSATSSALGAALNWSEEGGYGASAARNSAMTLADAYRAVCAGEPRGDAAPYEGTIHPMVMIGPAPDPTGLDVWESRISVADRFRDETDGSIPAALRPASANQIQLVACVTEGRKPAPSCGIYTRSSDGVSGELLRTTGTATVRVLVATTATEIDRRTFTGEEDMCPQAKGGAVSGDPPWTMNGIPPGLHEAYGFLSGFLNGSVR